jgi:hypothetical protein
VLLSGAITSSNGIPLRSPREAVALYRATSRPPNAVWSVTCPDRPSVRSHARRIGALGSGTGVAHKIGTLNRIASDRKPVINCRAGSGESTMTATGPTAPTWCASV